MTRTEIAGVVVFALFFAGGAFLAGEFSDAVSRYLDFGIAGMAGYVFVGIIATVIAPVSTVALIPFAAVLWGPVTTALLSVVGWTIGSVVAYVIARRFGKPFVARFVDLRTIERYEHALGEKYLFWNIVLLRMAVPVDILSYAVGLFTSVKLSVYVAATIIGILPFAFIFAYAAQATLNFQIVIGGVVLATIYLGYRKGRSMRR
ncbi:MAG: hypothetical protein A2408_01665 [Candidatus Yonathbacteria bacterium RIFOXYC1_FULL_52_10]|uniref:TVP38/TMEM64 family membrane protein n=1 Tax=Candidatus Yonathbacteria bacterium RIFOXYD1_FULL_52_36 TaxID=1802730 RepID=A0A1G2SIF3_9BACT|nr:MAG: hypothetical protein A2591_03385 [Candidatus Yonathbacteria bacterium RIFOXYD1_FULL_52_36]OHA84816.1 MAG: hypothetical protein A2408_01665 [Candidatus Yonathbacteria bacterium RIFOXYC1_FULL_52_10]